MNFPDAAPVHGNKGFKDIIVLFVSVSLLGGVASYFIIQYGKLAYQELETIQPIVQSENSSWKTYRNEKYGFEFMYPGELFNSSRGEVLPVREQVVNTEEKDPLSRDCLASALISSKFYLNKIGWNAITVCVSGDVADLRSLAVELGKGKREEDVIRLTRVDNTDALRLRYTGLQEGEYVLIPHGNFTIQITNHWQFLSEQDFDQLVRSIKLSSVKLISPNGGEIIKQGSRLMIKWDYSIIGDPSTYRVDITLSRGGNGPVYYEFGSKGPYGLFLGNYDLTKRSIEIDLYQNFISANDYEITLDFSAPGDRHISSDKSDSPFSIVK